MQDKPQENIQKQQEVEPTVHDQAGFYFSSMVKITDPNTNEVLVQVRGDE